MSPRQRLEAVVRLPAALMLGLVAVAAWLLSPWRVGRLLQAVCMPRLREHPMRTTLTVLGIAFGVVSVTAVLLVNRSVVAAAASTTDDLAGKADLQVTAGSAGFEDDTIDAVVAVKDVYKAAPVLEQTAIIPGADSERVLVLGVDLIGSDDRYFRGYGDAELAEVNKDPIAFVDSPTHLLLSRSLGERLHKRVHDTIELATPAGPQAFEIYGFMNDTGVARAFGGSVAMMHYQSMQAAFERGTKVDRIDVAVTPGTPVDAVAGALRAKLGPAFHVAPAQEKTSRIASMLGSLQAGLVCGGLLAAQIGLFLIYNTMLISIVQRKREIGIMRALGLTAGQVVRLLTLEGALLGVVASTLGVGMGIALASLMLRTMSRTVNEMYVGVAATKVQVDAGLVAGCLVFGVVTTLGAAFLAARSALRIRPVESLRTSGLVGVGAPTRSFTGRDGFGIALVAVAVLMLQLPPSHGRPVAAWTSLVALLAGGAALVPRLLQGVNLAVRRVLGGALGVEATMANENLPRDLARASVTTGALMVAVGMATGFAVLVGSFSSSITDWIDHNISADLFVSSTTPGLINSVAMTSALGARLAAVPQVESVERVRIANDVFRGHPVKLIAYDVDQASRYVHEDVVEGDYPSIVRDLEHGDNATVSENFSRRFSVHRGDTIELAGNGSMVSLQVVGVLVDYTSDLGSIMVDRATYLRGWGDDLVDSYKIRVVRGGDILAVRRAINASLGGRFDLIVLTCSEWRAQVTGLLERVFSIMRALEGVALAIAALGVLNALSANVLDRVREIGVLRAIGLQRRQVRKMIVLEALLIGIAGVLAGTLLGIELGHMLLAGVNASLTGWTLPFAPAWARLAELAVLVVAVSTTAGWYPARQAAALEVTNALAYE